MIAYAVKNKIVTLVAGSVIVLGVIDDFVSADRLDQIQIPRAADAGHVRAERLADLHCECAHASRGAINQDLAARPNLSMVAKALQRSQSRDVGGSGLLERNDAGFQRQL